MASEGLGSGEQATSEELRLQAVEALHALVEKGFEHPDDLPEEDEDVKRANELITRWESAQDRSSPEYNFLRTILYIDAGFSDGGYLDEVANEWLEWDIDEAIEMGNIELVERIKAKREEINSKLSDR